MSDDQTIFRSGRSRSGHSLLFHTGYRIKDTHTFTTNISGKMINIYSIQIQIIKFNEINFEKFLPVSI
jgi:hypothetical protein